MGLYGKKLNFTESSLQGQKACEVPETGVLRYKSFRMYDVFFLRIVHFMLAAFSTQRHSDSFQKSDILLISNMEA